MVLNLQSRVRVDVPAARRFLAKVRRALKLGRREITVCLMDDRAIRRLNAAFRAKPGPTDVLSFPWKEPRDGTKRFLAGSHELSGYLGDIVISAETARRNARAEGQSTQNEVRWLVLHGVLHLLGYDHETDSGEMDRMEHRLRARLGIG